MIVIKFSKSRDVGKARLLRRISPEDLKALISTQSRGTKVVIAHRIRKMYFNTAKSHSEALIL